MKFFKNWKKLNNAEFTTVRQNKGYYRVGQTVECVSPGQTFQAVITKIEPLKQAQVTDEFAMSDAETTREGFLKLMAHMYGPEFDDFIIIYLKKT